MRSLVVLLALVAVSASLVIPRGNSVFLNGALCRPCVDVITNGENEIEVAFNEWFDKETNRACADLGFLKDQCVQYFKQYENDFDHFITTKANPLTSCKAIEFC